MARILTGVFIIMMTAFAYGVSSRDAEACCSCCLVTDHAQEHYDTVDTIMDATSDAIDAIVQFLYANSPNTFWEGMVLPQLRIMTQEISTLNLNFPAAIGGFLDGQTLQEATLRMQKLSAESARRQIPAVSMCQFATLTKSLNATETARLETTRAVARIDMKRNTLNSELLGAESPYDDINVRFDQFSRKYCMDVAGSTDFGGVLKDVCNGVAGTGNFTQDRKKNRDIDFAQMLGTPSTISASMYPGYGPQESLSQFEDIFALSKNLYGTNTNMRMSVEELKPKADDEKDYLKYKLLDQRNFLAKRSVAQNSFAHYIGLKSATDKADGTELAVKPQLEGLLNALGIDNSANNQINDYFNKAGNGLTESSPSYWAQMEVLTKKAYQNPNFFANLYDNPHNVRRQQTAMKAIELMQERDIHETALRTEMLLSLWLDTELIPQTIKVSNDLSTMKAPKK